MSLKNVALFDAGGTGVTITIPNGSPEIDLVSSPVTPVGGLQMLFAEDGNAQIRRTLTFRSKLPTYDAKAKTWSKGRREITLSEPFEVATGVFQSKVTRLIVEIPSVVDMDDVAYGIDHIVQVAKDPGVQQFLTIGTLD